MRKIINLGLVILAVISFSSCLKAGLDDLPVYEGAEISNVRFEYRWWDEAAKRLRVVEFSVEKEITENLVTCTITVPGTNDTFTEQIRNGVSLSNIVCSLDISAAARVKPVGGSPELGVPADFSAKEFDYRVTAASGATKDWTIIIKELKK